MLGWGKPAGKHRVRPDLGLAPGAKGATHIDIVVTDLAAIASGNPQQEGEAFRGRCHEAVVEVKWFLKSVSW
jgi:hypothetical protein